MKILEPFKRLLRVASRPVQEERGYQVVPYRGYGSREEVFLIGSVFHQPTSSPKDDNSTGRLLVQIGRRLLRRGVSGVEIEMRFAGSTRRVETDAHGYFRVHMDLAEPPSPDRLWHTAEVELISGPKDQNPSEVETARADIFIPPENADFVVVSDIDDTVMYTGVANKVKMFWRLFAERADSRVAFPGVAAFYRALHAGPSGESLNPILYVSRGPWGIYDMLDEFFNQHDIPIGPILFLREWDVRLKSPLPKRAEGHKKDLVRKMLSLYAGMPFVLIGDSGQHDPEIYGDIVREHRGRVKAVYIRDVSGSSTRENEIAKLAEEVQKSGASLMLADDSYAMARHAAEHGYISESALSKVLDQRVKDAEPQPERTTGPVEVE